MEQKLIIYVERQLGYARSWKNNSKTIESSEMKAYIARTIAALETKAFAAVEFFCETICDDDPKLRERMCDRWDEWKKEFFELSIS